jgi:tetratricopeptide (TPR) repeat protein
MEGNVEVLRFGKAFHAQMQKGIDQLHRGDPQGAIPIFEEGLTLARARGSESREAIALGNIGFAHMSLGQLGEAESFFAQALQISERVGDADLHARQLASLGNLMEMKGNEARASEYYELAMQRYQGSKKGG